MLGALLALAWLLGIVVAAFTGADTAASLAIAGLLASGSFAYRPRLSTLVVLPVVCALVFLALVRYDATEPQADSVLADANAADEVTVLGVIDDEPREDGATVLYRVAAERVFVGDWNDGHGHVLLRLPAPMQYEYGDRIELVGDLDEPPTFPGFDYREYLLRNGVTSLASYPDSVRLLSSGHGDPVHEAIFDARTRLSEALSDALPEPHASLAGGVLFGARSGMPTELRESMAATGTSHLVAVSGQNITILAGLIVAGLAWIIGRRRAAWVALAAIGGYTLLVGFDASIVRAAVMGSLYLVATLLGRQNSTPVALVMAGAVMTAWEPQIVHDVGFQLSFAATLGLTTLAPMIREALESAAVKSRLFGGVPAMRGLIETLAVTLAAIAATLPISAITFDRVSLIAPLANLLAVPAFVAVAFTSAVAAGITLVVPSAALIGTFIGWPPAAYMIGVINFCAGLPGASVEVSGVSEWHAVAWYAVLAAVWWRFGQRMATDEEDAPQLETLPGRRLVPLAGLASVAVLGAALAWLALPYPSDDRMSVTFLDVGQGDAILIEDAGGHRVLIDGGPAGQEIGEALGRQLPFYDRRIDLVVLTHPDGDHLGGLLEVIEEYDVRGVVTSAVAKESGLYETWVRALDASGIPLTTADAGERIALDGGVIEVLAPDADDVLLPTEELNETSTILRLTAGDVSFLFTGDIGENTEATLIRSDADLDATVLKVGHHGSRFSGSDAFLSAVTPVLSVISVGGDNRYGHPADETLARLADTAVLRTDEDGDITVSTDGKRVWVDTQR